MITSSMNAVRSNKTKYQSNTYKSIAFAFFCGLVHNNDSLFDLSILFEMFAEALTVCVVGEASYEYFGEGGIILGDRNWYPVLLKNLIGQPWH